MAKYGLRILIDTVKGRQFSYIACENQVTSSILSQSLFNSDNFPNYAMSSSQVWDRITGSISCSFQNSFLFDSGSNAFNTSSIFSDSNYLSSSISGSAESGSIQFHFIGLYDKDRLKRYKFFGNASCQALGITENFWYRPEKFKLTNSPIEKNYIRADIDATSLTVLNNFNVATRGSITSNLPFKIDTGADRLITFRQTEPYPGSNQPTIPFNALSIGYERVENVYMISASDDVTFNIVGVNNLDVTNMTVTNTSTTNVETITTKIVLGDGDYITDDDSDTMIRFNHAAYNNSFSNTNDDTIAFSAGSTALIRQVISPNIIHINPYNQPYDFRFDGDTNDHLFFISGSTEKIGILTSTPSKTLTVQGDISASGKYYAGGPAVVGPAKTLEVEGNISASGHVYLTPGKRVNFNGNNTDYILYNEASDRMDIVSGRICLMPAGVYSSVGIGTQTPSKKLTVAGDISASGNIYATPYLLYETSSISSTGNIQGDIVKFGNTTTVAGAIYAHTGSGWVLAHSGSNGNASSSLGLAAGTNSTTNGMLLRGMANIGYDPGGNNGCALYLEAPGSASNTKSATSGHIGRVVGWNYGSDTIYFNPDNTWVKVA